MSGCTSRKTPGHRLAAQTLHIVIVSLMLLAPTVATAQGYKILYAFCPGASTCPDGSGPVGGLIQDASGNLYGTAGAGGANNWGTVFKLDTAGHETVLYSFCAAAGCADGVEPLSSLFRDAAGNLYGTTADYGGYGATVFKLSASGQETVLLNLGNVGTTNLIQDAAGNFYSTTSLGGANDGGTVFKLDPAGHQTVLWSFCAAMYCSDGVGPQGGVIRDAAGNLYGTTNTGGINVISNVQGAQGGGTVFKLDASGHHIVLYNFCPAANCPDGLGPVGSLVQDAAGNLYGVTDEGGANGAGTVFKVDPTGLETVLWSFCSAANCADGQQPMGTLVQDVLGNLYGTTQLGGTYGNGTVFKLDPSGHQTVLHSFGAFTGDGMNPIAGLWMDASGNLYGTTTQGGVSGIINDNVPVSFGTIFELTAGSSGNTTAITIQTAPPGLQFSVDGGPLQMAPLTLNLAAGNHTIAVAATQAGPPGTQYLFASWSDGGAVSHSISVGASAATYTAAFTTQYQLTIAAAPPAGGTVSPASGGFYNAGTSVPVSAMPNDGFIFTGWTGSVANASSASTSVTMNAPEMVTANFSSGGATFSLNPKSIDVLAAAGNGTVMVSAPSPTATWTAVSNSPFLTITSGASGTGSGTVGFAVAANTTARARTGTLTIAGLTFTVNQAAVTTAGLGFFPVTPCRVVDTRSGQGFTGQFGPPSMTANQTRSFTIPSSGCNIPAGAQAYSLNVTVAPQAVLGYLTIWPTGQLQPFVSTLNSLNGAILANAAIVPAGANGAVSVFVTNATDVIIDINGYFAPPTATALAAIPHRVF